MDASEREPEPPSRSLSRVVGMLVWIAAAALTLAWVTGIGHRQIDYDEVSHAHTLWQIAEGRVPFHDFFECHPPFLWYLLLPIYRWLPETPDAIFALRWLSGLATLAWVAALGANLKAGRPGLAPVWIISSLGIVLATRTVLDNSTQFRLDAFGAAVFFGSLWLFQTRTMGSRFWRHAGFGFAASLCVLALPKLILIPPAFASVNLVRDWRRGKPVASSIFGYGLGITSALVLSILALLALGIEPLAVWDLSIRYHLLFSERAAFEQGLVEEVLAQPALLTLIAAGLLSWVTWLKRHGETPSSFELAILIACLGQLWLVRYPHIQYVAPWFVLAAIFLPYLGRLAEELGGETRLVLRVALPILCTAVAANSFVHYGERDRAQPFMDVQQAILEIAPEDSTIMVPPPFHPIARRDALYGLIHSWAPNGTSPEDLLRELDLDPYQEMKQVSRYRSELEENRPAVILFTGRMEFFYSAEQAQAIATYLDAHVTEYRRLVGISPPLYVRTDLVEEDALHAELHR